MAKAQLSLEQLRRYAIGRSLFNPTTLPRAITKLGFVQADPIRAPARAQDLTLRHRVKDYRAGELEKRYAKLGLEEDFFVNYGYLPREIYQMMHPRALSQAWTPLREKQSQALLAFITEHGPSHPRKIDAHFAHGRVKNWFGGSSNASTQLLDAMHYRGLLRVACRESGTRIYELAQPWPDPASNSSAKMDALIDIVVGKYAPLPAASLGQLVRYLIGGVPQWKMEKASALARTKARLATTTLDGVQWYWPTKELPRSAKWEAGYEAGSEAGSEGQPRVRLLAPFDPVVWDRRRFELFWGWRYRFEAYTPPAKRQLGYYALPLLWQDQVIGWANLTVVEGALQSEFGYVSGAAPRGSAYRNGLENELSQIKQFLGLLG